MEITIKLDEKSLQALAQEVSKILEVREPKLSLDDLEDGDTSILKDCYQKIADEFNPVSAAFLLRSISLEDLVDQDKLKVCQTGVDKTFLNPRKTVNVIPLKSENDESYKKLKIIMSKKYTEDVFEEEFPSQNMLTVMYNKYKEDK